MGVTKTNILAICLAMADNIANFFDGSSLVMVMGMFGLDCSWQYANRLNVENEAAIIASVAKSLLISLIEQMITITL